MFIDADVLMAIPELYRYGREGEWFGMKWFSVYMLDGVYQVRPPMLHIFFSSSL